MGRDLRRRRVGPIQTKAILSVRKFPAALVAGAVLLSLTACGGGDDTASSSAASGSSAASSTAMPAAATESGDQSVLSKVKVTRKDDRKTKPKVEIPTPVSDDATAGARLINQGDGDAIGAGQTLSLNIAAVQGTDGSAVSGDDYDTAKSVAMKDSSFTGGLEDAYAVLQKSKIGADVGVVLPTSLTGNVPQVWIMHVAEAKDPTVTWKKSTTDTPTEVTAAASDGKYSITIPKGDAPKKLQVKVLKKGTSGKAATASSTVTAFYDGAQWENATQFDGNFESDATSFGLDGVIKGWTQGLKGLKAGSVVLLSIPSDLAYGDNPSQGQPSGPLVFIVKITKVA